MRQNKNELERLAKQRERQQLYRERMKAERKPDRDDIARVSLKYLINFFDEQDKLYELNGFIICVVKILESQGFNKAASHKAFGELIEKYTTTSWKPRKRSHIDRPSSGDQD